VNGQDFTIITDHASLKWLMSQSDLSSRLARWALKLQAYQFKIEQRRGKLIAVPGVLSRDHDCEFGLRSFQVVGIFRFGGTTLGSVTGWSIDERSTQCTVVRLVWSCGHNYF